MARSEAGIMSGRFVFPAMVLTLLAVSGGCRSAGTSGSPVVRDAQSAPEVAGLTAGEAFSLGNEARNPDEQIRYYTRVVQLEPGNARAYHNRGISWKKKGKLGNAIADFNRAIELKPDYAVAYYNRGNAWYDKYSFTHARADYDKAIELKPDFAEAYCNRSRIWYRKKEYLQALDDMEKALALRPDDRTYRETVAHIQGRLSIQQNR